MAKIVKTIDEIMIQENRDMLFVRFDQPPTRRGLPNPSRQRHLDWFESRGLRYELAAPKGWLEGDPGIFAVYFDGPDDPRVAEYSSIFEDGTGKSLIPEDYQMLIVTYASWSQDRS
ncbi:hypothetical protein [Microvirga tunisiensis]|uniref:Uncharacterized protein n=1 Tax=Microvirga tunisiensis TaxID=2108360 RepID=A0A5N7MT02_9HYPH|nr:hypothetical protein [Microvirga tunisiensis]MPR11769.1 hypothetical protein [Microvirga tunisiensis]MPR29780.1 hypothetical protein [Microvirga tunisiensis]